MEIFHEAYSNMFGVLMLHRSARNHKNAAKIANSCLYNLNDYAVVYEGLIGGINSTHVEKSQPRGKPAKYFSGFHFSKILLDTTTTFRWRLELSPNMAHTEVLSNWTSHDHSHR